jgi:hypothetical protein
MFGSGNPSVDQPLLGSIVVLGSTNVQVDGSLSVQIPISDSIIGSLLRIYVALDGDISTLTSLPGGLNSGTYNVDVSLASYSLSAAPHVAGFYAVNDLGFVSEPVAVPFVATIHPTRMATQTRTQTQFPIASQSPAPYPSSSPFKTCYPIVWLWNSPADSHFDIHWRGLTD